MNFKKIICLDFDGVLHSYKSGWKGARNIPDPPVEGAIEWLLELVGTQPENLCAMAPPARLDVCIYSSRSKSFGGRRAMKKWLIRHGVDSGYFADKLIRFPVVKPAAWLTIDDRAICFDGNFPTIEEIENFVPWYKKVI
jgi:hypothetical protein